MDEMTVGELVDLLEEFDPEAPIRIAWQPYWPFESRFDRDSGPLTLIEVGPDGEEMVYLVQGDQIGYLPDAVREELGWK